MKAKKGDYGYIRAQKIKRSMITLLTLALPVGLFLIGYFATHTRKNLLTLVAILGCLPACKFMVGAIMMYLQKPLSEETYQKIHTAAGELVMSYEMYVTTYDKSLFLDAAAVCGNTVVFYTSKAPAKELVTFMEGHIQNILRQNGYRENVKILTELAPFLERMRYMNQHVQELNADIRFRPDELYPELSRDELVKHTILAISL